MKHLEQLLREAVVARKPEEISRLIREGADSFAKGPDGRDARDLVFDIDDSALRLECRRALTILTLQRLVGGIREMKLKGKR